MNATIIHNGNEFLVNFYYSTFDGCWVAEYAGDGNSNKVFLTDNLNVNLSELTEMLKGFLKDFYERRR